MHQFFATTHKGHTICVERDGDNDDWYVTVEAPTGLMLVDGWWRNSEDKNSDEAIQYAKKGARLK